MTEPISLDDLARRLAVHAEALCEELLPGGKRIGSEWRCGSVAGEAGSGKHGGSLAVELKGRRRGLWADFGNSDRHKGDLLHLVAATQGLDLGAAAAWALRWLGLSGDRPRPRRRRWEPKLHRAPAPQEIQQEQEEALSKRAFALKTWREALPMAGSLGEIYLRARGITIPAPPSLRFAPELRHTPTDTRWPGIVGLVQAPDRTPIGIWRTYLAEDGNGKAPIIPPRMGLAWEEGAALRLGPAGVHLAICEGWENGLSMMQAIPGLYAWAGLTAWGLRMIALPPEVEEVTILADWDFPSEDKKGKTRPGAGQKAAMSLKQRLLLESGFLRSRRLVRIVWPPKPGVDFNDILKGAA